MPFQKGHKGMGGGRKPNGKRSERAKQKNTSMDIVRYSPHKWEKNSTARSFDIDEVDYYLYNDLDITELMDNKKLPSYGWKTEKGYNMNSSMKKRKDEENGDKDL